MTTPPGGHRGGATRPPPPGRAGPGRARRALAGAALALGLAAPVAAQPAASPGTTAAPTAARALPALPRLPPIQAPEVTAAAREELDRLLARLVDASAETRAAARAELLEVPPSLVGAIDARLGAIADAGERTRMRDLLERTRKAAKRERARLPKAERDAVVDPLPALLQRPAPEQKAWRDLVSVLAMIRMLAQIGTLEAVRELIDVHVRFGEFVRVDVQLRLAELGDRAVPALIEARRHPAEKVGRWAGRQLDALGKAIPGEAVRVEDPRVLADVLRAYGRTRDLDSARIVISFANSERAQIREAARQAIAGLGEPATWQLREAWESTVGKRAPRDWAWDRIARELFAEADRLRLSRVHELFEQGLAAEKRGDLAGMTAAWDKVLARSPEFERRSEMVAGYVAFAHATLDRDRDAALLALTRASRLAPDAPARAPLESLRLTLEAEAQAQRGLGDASLLRRAVELDAQNGRARAALARLERGEVDRTPERRRWTLAGVIAGVALLALGWIGLSARRGRGAPAQGGAPAPDGAAPDGAAQGGAPAPDGAAQGGAPAPDHPPGEAATAPDPDPPPPSGEGRA